jgi:hypothetical protein
LIDVAACRLKFTRHKVPFFAGGNSDNDGAFAIRKLGKDTSCVQHEILRFCSTRRR